MFQHETDTVIQKASSHASRRTSNQGTRPTRNKIAVSLPTTAPLKQPAHPPSFQAISLFASAYADGVYLEYLPIMYLRHSRPASLEKSFEAVALGHMANEEQREDLRQLAHRTYGDALSHIKVALQAPAAAASTETMASILLLALYEAISPASSKYVQDIWSTHIRGALAAISQCSLSAVFQTPIGQSLLHHIISVVQIDCIYRRIPFPDQLRSLYSVSWHREGPQGDMWSILDRLATLNSQFIDYPISLSYLENLQNLENNIQCLLISMPKNYPDSFAFTDITPTEKPVSGSGKHPIPSHQFQSFRIAQAWNILRLMCLLTTTLLTSGIDSYMEYHAMNTEELIMKLRESRRGASRIARAMIIDICATVPDDLRPGNWSYNPHTRMQYSAWARSLLWPLSMCLKSPHGSKELLNYIDRQLEILAVVARMRSLHSETSNKGYFPKDW
jgi:hypothetical protein